MSAGDTLTVVLDSDIDPANAPVPLNAAERLVFRHLYATLIDVDCSGRALPALAESWTSQAGGRSWRFTLRRDVRFVDGRPLTVRDVVEALSRQREIRVGGVVVAVFDSLEAIDEHALTVHLASPWRGPPTLFADPALAIAAPASDSRWPVGTRGRLLEARSVLAGAASPNEITLEPGPSHDGPTLRFRLLGRLDPRDALEAGAALLLSGDREVLEYVATRGQYMAAPLLWDRIYVVVAPGRVRELRRGSLEPESGNESLGAELREALARDAVPTEARGHRPEGWWEELARCAPHLEALRRMLPPIPPGAYQIAGVRRLVFPEADRVARGLAERIVALAADPGLPWSPAASIAAALPGLEASEGELVATGVGDAAFADRLSAGSDFAYLFPLPYRVYDPCRAALNLIRRAEWLAAQELDLSSTLVPLVETRRQVVVRRGRVGVALEWDGTPRLFGSAAKSR